MKLKESITKINILGLVPQLSACNTLGDLIDEISKIDAASVALSNLSYDERARENQFKLLETIVHSVVLRSILVAAANDHSVALRDLEDVRDDEEWEDFLKKSKEVIFYNKAAALGILDAIKKIVEGPVKKIVEDPEGSQDKQ